MRRTRHVVLPVRSWQYVGLMVVSLACLTLGLISRDRGGRSGSLGGSELMHTAPHEVDACPNKNPFGPVFPYDDQAHEKGSNGYTAGHEHDEALSGAESGMMSRSNDRAIDTGGRTRRIDLSRARIDTSVSRIRSRVLGARDKPNSLLREKREILDGSRSARTDRRNLESSRSRGRFSDRTHGSKSFVFPERSSSTVRSEASDRYRRSSSVDRRNRETTVSRDVSTRSRQQASQELRTNGRREDQSLDRRIADSDRRDRSRSIAGRAIRSMRDSRRSTERVRALVQEDQRRPEPTREQRSGINRIDTTRAGIRLQERSLVERTELNQRETRQRLAHRSEKQKTHVRRSLSEDFDRVDARRMELRASRISRSENQRKETSARASIARHSSLRNSEPVNVSRMRVRSDDRRSSTSGINRERVWIDSLRRDVRKNENSERKERSAGRDVSRERQTERSERRRTLSMRTLPKGRQSEGRERLDTRHVSERRRQEPLELSVAREYGKTASRELPQASRRNSEQERRTETTRVARILDSERSGRLTVRRTREVKKSQEIRETSSLGDSRRTSERNSMRRDVPISRVSRATSPQDLRRPAGRLLTRELGTSGERRETSNLRDSRRTAERNSFQRDVLVSRVSRATRSERTGRLADRVSTRELGTSGGRRETSNLRDSRRTAERNSLQRDVLVSRVSWATRSERTGRSADRVSTRELGTSGERRETSNLRDSRRTAERNSLQRDVLVSRVSRATRSERTGRSADRVSTRELGTSGERRETSNLRDSRRTAERNSLQRDVPVSRGSRVTSPQDLRRSADRILTRELARSGERRETSNLRDSRRTTERNALERDTRRARVSTIASSDRREHRLAQDRRERNTERRVRSTVRQERDQTSRLNSILPDARASRISRNPDVERNERDVSQGRRVSRGQIDVARSERRIIEETRVARDARNRQIMNERSRINFRTMSNFANIEKPSSVKSNDYLHHTLVLALCAIYGASLLRGKGGFYGFRNILNPVNRFVLW